MDCDKIPDSQQELTHAYEPKGCHCWVDRGVGMDVWGGGQCGAIHRVVYGRTELADSLCSRIQHVAGGESESGAGEWDTGLLAAISVFQVGHSRYGREHSISDLQHDVSEPQWADDTIELV